MTDPNMEANVALGHAFFMAQDELRGGPAPELCAPDYTATLGSNPPMDRAAHEAFARGFYAGYPDAKHRIEHVFASENHVAVRFVIVGTHDGDYFGIPATGRSVSIPANVLLDVSDGKVRTLTAVFDEAGLLRQIGVLPNG